MSTILGLDVHATNYAETVARSLEWAARQESRSVIFANVHVVMEAFDDPTFRSSLNNADLVNPDGVPLVWALRAMGKRHATRVCGPDAMLHLLEAAEKNTVPVGFYGGSSIGLKRLIMRLRERYPRLQIAFEMSPPFRELSVEEDDQVVRDIASSGARLLFVGLGCPKQEKWITSHAGRVHAVMFGVGAAFDFIAGTKPQAPRWMMRIGFEWCFRLASEPRRLTKRYLKHNPRFVAYFLGQLLAEHAPLIFGGGSN